MKEMSLILAISSLLSFLGSMVLLGGILTLVKPTDGFLEINYSYQQKVTTAKKTTSDLEFARESLAETERKLINNLQ